MNHFRAGCKVYFAPARDFLDGSAKVFHFVMRVFLVLPFRAMAGKFHPQFKRHVLICQRGRETVAQGVEGTLGKHLIALALTAGNPRRPSHDLLKSFGKPGARPLPRWPRLRHDENFRLVCPRQLCSTPSAVRVKRGEHFAPVLACV